MFGGEIFKEHFLKNICQNICNMIAIKAAFHFSHYKSEVVIATRVLIRLQQKHNYSFPRPIDVTCEIWSESASWLQRRCCFKMLTDDGRTKNSLGRRYILLIAVSSAPVEASAWPSG